MRLTVERCRTSRVEVHVPPEILANIFKQLASPKEFRVPRYECLIDIQDFRGPPTDEIRRLRLVCKAFEFAAAPFLIQTVYVSSSQRDLDVLTAVSNHPVFSKHVTELVYDCRMFDRALMMDKQSYVEEIKRLPHYAFGEGTLLTKALAKESYQHYATSFRSQEECREKQLDMKCLAEAFPKMPHLAHISVRSRSRTRFIPLKRSLVHHPDRRVTEVHMIPPQARVLWRRDDRTRRHNEVCQKGIVDFLTTVSEASIGRQIRSISIGHPTDQEELKLCSELFGSSTESVERCGRLFKNLKRIQLAVRIDDDHDGTWPGPPHGNNSQDDYLECQSRLRWALGFARSLEYLHLNFRCAYRRPGNDVQLNHIFSTPSKLVKCDDGRTHYISDDLHFPNLQELRLTSVPCLQSTVLNFIERHVGVLKRLSLSDVFFIDGTWVAFIDRLKELDLRLESCELGLRHRPEVDGGYPRYIPPKAVIDYLNGGEQHPLEDITVEDLEDGELPV